MEGGGGGIGEGEVAEMEALGSTKVGLMTCLARHCREPRLIFSDVINLFIGGVPSPPRSSPLSCVFSLVRKFSVDERQG